MGFEQRIFQIPFEIHLEIANSVIRWEAQLPATRGKKLGASFLHKQANGTDVKHSLYV